MGPEHREFAKELDRGAGIDSPPPDWSYFPVAEITTPDDVVEVEFWPASSRALTSWMLWIGSAGTPSMIGKVCRPFGHVERRHPFRRVRVGRREARRDGSADGRTAR